MDAFSLANCFPFLSARKKEIPPSAPADPRSRHPAAARTFSFKELAAATRNFSDDCRIVGQNATLYKGYLKSVNQVFAIKLYRAVLPNATTDQGNREFLAHVLTMSTLRHPNIMSLTGFCADGDHRILVHEYMPLGSLEDHLHLHDSSRGKAPLDWITRMNIAARVARGLEYLYSKGVVYRCIRSSDILLGDGYHPKLSQYGLVNHGRLAAEAEWNIAFSNTTLDTLAPEIIMGGKLLPESCVYSFGILLLELITGRRAVHHPQKLMEDPVIHTWAASLLKDKREFHRMADPALEGRYRSMDLQEVLEVASMCVHNNPTMRAPIGTVVTALSRLAYDPPESSHQIVPS